MKLRVILELPSNEALCSAAAASDFATVVSETAARPGVDAGNLRIIPLDLGAREFCLIYHPERRLSRAAQAFVEFLKRFDQPLT